MDMRGFSDFFRLDEIDWEGEFSDVQVTCLDQKTIVEYLNAVRRNAPLSTDEREKFSRNLPFVHSKSAFFKDTGEGIDVEHFIAQITAKPNNLVNTNEKILKSGGIDEYVYKSGIPAFRGIVYDKRQKKFFVINTCPGAGKCVVVCYALRGNYIRYAQSYDSMTRRLNLLLNHPEQFEQQLYRELRDKCEEHGARKGYRPTVVIRWNDSGDFFTKKYVDIAESVIARLGDEGYNIKPYAYTKVADVAEKGRVGLVTFSQGGKPSQAERVSSKRRSYIIPKSVFEDLDLMKISDEAVLKSNIIAHMRGIGVKVSPSNLLTYQELMRTPVASSEKWFVIVTSRDGDDAAFRADVRGILLLEH